jgi:outer membrane receptor for ferrienterochelin and colicin
MHSKSSGVLTAQNDSISLGFIANVNLNYSGERSSFSAGYSNATLPSAIGQTVQNQSFSISYSYRIKQNISLDLITNYTNSQSIGSQTGSTLTNNFNRDYLIASLGLAWQINKDWQLKGSYLYRWQHYPQQGTTQSLFAGTANSNTVMLFLNYAWDGISNAH